MQDHKQSKTEKAGHVYLDASLRPHRSLGPMGFALVMASIALGGFALGLAFLLVGAWPVAGFAGLEIALLFIAFKLNYRSGRVSEHLKLTDDGLEVVRISPNGKRSRIVLEPGWLQVRMDDPPEHHSQLIVGTKGKGLVLGAFLMPDERLEVAKELQVAIDRYRTPTHLKTST